MTADQLRKIRVKCEKRLQFGAQTRNGRKVGCSKIKGTDSRSNCAEKAS
jgi:hypothetical protein